MLWLLVAAVVFLCSFLFKTTLAKNKDGGAGPRRTVRRRTSLASTIGVDRVMLEKHVGIRQNVVNAVLSFERGEAPTRGDMIPVMKKLATRFERMRSRPVMTEDGETCEWTPIENLNAAIDSAITEDLVDLESEASDEKVEYEIMQRVEKYKAEILPTNPAWRVVVLRPYAVLVRIDHCIGENFVGDCLVCSFLMRLRSVLVHWLDEFDYLNPFRVPTSVGDGLTLVTLLNEIGTRTEGILPLELSDLSPLLKRFESLGDWRVYLSPLKLLWPPSFLRAFSLFVSYQSGPEEHCNPLRPPQETGMKVIPAESYGTVYFPTLPLSLLKHLAQSAGIGTTINDVVLFCFGDAVREYFSRIGSEAFESIRLLLPIANPIRPSLYGDEYEGLCNHMTPVIFPLDVSDRIREKPQESLDEIKQNIDKVKKSNTPLLMTTMNTLFERIIPLEKVFSASEAAFRRISCVYSNVPGPTTKVSISGRGLKKIQVIMPHPTSIFQMLSYDGNVFCNITVDTRTARKSWLLRDAFMRATRRFADEFGCDSVSVRAQIDELAQSREWGGAASCLH